MLTVAAAVRCGVESIGGGGGCHGAVGGGGGVFERVRGGGREGGRYIYISAGRLQKFGKTIASVVGHINFSYDL